MKKNHFVLALVVSFISAGSFAMADIVSVAFTVSGGNTATDGITGTTLTEPRLTYNSLDPIDVAITVNSAATYLVNEAPGFGNVVNSSGVAWSGFTWELISGPSASFIYNNVDNQSGFDGGVTFPPATGTATLATFSGGLLANGDAIDFQPVFKFTGNDAGIYTIRETPIPVPEPGTLLLTAVGAIGLLSAGRRR